MIESGKQTSSIAATEQAQQVIARCRELALCSEIEGEITRTFLAPSMHRVHALLGGWMQVTGMQVRVDAAGNMRGVLPAAEPNAPRLLIGSHLDTVANAGAFDGVLGVVMGVALIDEMARDKPLPFAIEVIGFSEEEGVRFSKPFLGSLALIGELDAETLACTDTNGVTVVGAIRNFGLDPAALPTAVVDQSAFAYLEFHIEQGPVLESEGLALGVVDAIAGQTRMTFTFTGHANHAGTTPMGPLRHDALAAAAEWIVEVERYAGASPGLVATVGKVEVPSAAGNVIPGACIATLDVRHAQDAVRQAAVKHYLDCANRAGAARGVTAARITLLDQAAVPMDTALTSLLADAAARTTNQPARIIASGAGHDAMIVARRVPAAMLFLRSPGGLSHHPDEAVLPGDVEAALATGVEFLRRLRDDRAMLERIAARTSPRKRGLHA
ncbi:MAG: allantoate amidohydrolase [Acidobacteriaceae bacterium]